MDTINLGDPQPKKCSKCDTFGGYQVEDKVRGSYTLIYESDGNVFGGAYTDSMRTTKAGTRAVCANCCADLKLKVNRNDF